MGRRELAWSGREMGPCTRELTQRRLIPITLALKTRWAKFCELGKPVGLNHTGPAGRAGDNLVTAL